MRICWFDIETTNLNADLGRILCASVLTHEGKMLSFRNDALAKKHKTTLDDDRHLAVALRDELEKHHVVCGWYSKGFDIPFLNTRLVAGGHRPVRPHLHVDLRWHMSGWRGLKPRSASLAVAAEFFKLGERKQKVDVEVWTQAAMAGGKAGAIAIDELVERCESDVRLLKDVNDRIFDTGLVRNIQSYP